MKQIFCFFVGFISLTVSAEVVTMDLSTATDMSGAPIEYGTEFGNGYYDGTDVWDSTYNDSERCQFIYTNGARFMLSHLPSMNSYGGQSWEGFTLSKVSKDTANVFGCLANGGTAGLGTPYVIGYFSEWVSNSLGYSSNIICFDQEYYPEYVYICQNSNTMEAITNGNIFNARAFTEKDTLTLIISGINEFKEETNHLIYYLAINGTKNDRWIKVPLTSLGKTRGLSFRMTSTDIGQFGVNTPLYFALDSLTVSTEHPTNTQHILYNTTAERVEKIIVNSHLMILYKGELYTLDGQHLK
jgi:hypothetical protein